ncbi:MAG TPA: cobalamin-binding protein [Candidatus Binatia bacterium]|jgi:iron complex transport system substrate-binding protein
MRICSLLPGATEIAYLLGLGDQIVGVTHECDYPAEARYKRVIVRSAIDPNSMSSQEIDRKVGELLQSGKGLYTIDEQALLEIAPDMILTQGLCDVCALDYNDVVKAAARLASAPAIVSLNPHSLNDVLEDILRVGAATARELSAESLVRDLRRRIDEIGFREPNYRPRVVCLEWFDPLYVAGHWVPEIVTLAGGHDVLGRAGEPSFKIDWSAVRDAKPDVMLLMPCGFDVRRAVRESSPLRALPSWDELPAVKRGNVYAFNGSAYFSRPGPRLVNGLEILARVLQPRDAEPQLSPADAARIN